ncbi:MAG: hypothetical protein FJW95_12665 [Actinobacteria bacterium]|nr:hypothetical protein [Actinomycetota bacterium]
MKRSVFVVIALSLAAFGVTAGAGPASAGSNDKAIAEAGIIEASDVPRTFTASPQDRSGAKKTLALARRTKGCSGFVKFQAANEAATKAESDQFETGSEDLSNVSYVHKSEAVATRLMDSLGASSTADCLQDVLQKRTELQVKADPDLRRQVVDVTLTLEQTDLGDVATSQLSYEGVLSLELKDGSTDDLNVALVAIQVERVILSYSVSATPASTNIADVFRTAVTNTVNRTFAAL